MAVVGSTEHVLVTWINSLPPSVGIAPISSLGDIADGVSLSKILVDVDKEYFDSSAIDPPLAGEEKPSFIATVRNLKPLYKALSTYYTDILHLGTLDDSSVPNVSLLAKDGSIQDAAKLVRLVLLVCVNNATKNAEYLDSIQRISDAEAKNILLEIIAENRQRVDLNRSGLPTEHDIEARIQTEVGKVVARYELLETAHAELQEQNSVLQDNYGKLEQENASLKQQVAHLGGMSKLQAEIAEKKAKSETEYLQQEMQDLEEQLAEKDKKQADSDMKMKELVIQIEAIQVELENAAALNDRLDEAKHEIDRLRKVANQVEKYKKQAEEAEDLQRQLHIARNENTYLVEKSKLLDEDTQQVFGLRRQVDILQSECDFYRRKAKEAESSADQARQEHAVLQERITVLEDDHERDLAAISGLEEKIQDLEASAISHAEGSLKDAQDQDLRVTVNDLTLEVARLQHELAAYQANSVTANTSIDSPNVSEELETSLRDPLHQKDKLHDDYLTVYEEKLGLQAQVDAIEDGSLDPGPQLVVELRNSLLITENALQETKMQLEELQDRFNEQGQKLLLLQADLDLVDKDKKDILAGLRKSVSQRLQELQKDYDSLRLQKEDLQKDRERQADLLNESLIEKESIYQKLTASHEELLEVSRANTALRTSLVSLDPNAGGYESELKSWVIDLQKRVETQREKLRKSQVYIKKLKAENESYSRKTPDESKKRAISPEEAATIKRELALMTSAWYALTARIQQNKVIVVKKVDDSPESWLNRQRKILEDKI
ncbi:HOOK protein-domain-containing protein [Lipomyces kononenkoae]